MNLAAVIIQLKQGDHQAFKKLVYDYSGKLMTVARLYTINSEDAKDVLQDAFILIYQNIGKFKGIEEKALLAWMKKIVMNAALGKYKRMRYKRESNTLDIVPEQNIDPDVYQSFEREDLMKMIYKLPVRYKQVVGLYAIEGYSHREIGEMLGIDASTSRSAYSRAKKILKGLAQHNKLVGFQ